VGRLPVVDRRDPRRLVGYLGRSHVLSAFLRHIEQEQMRQPGSLSRMALTLKKNAVTRWMLNRAKKEPVPASPETKAPAR
jgi:hypothetical protein